MPRSNSATKCKYDQRVIINNRAYSAAAGSPGVRPVTSPKGAEGHSCLARGHQHYSGEREARAIFLFPLPKAGVWGFIPRKIFEIANARMCVLIYFKAPKLLINNVLLLWRKIYFWSVWAKTFHFSSMF